jgi:hypothetical protein
MQDPTALVPRPPARCVTDDSMGRQYHLPSLPLPLVEGVTYTRQAPGAPCHDVPIPSLGEPLGFQASTFIGGIDDLSPVGNLVPWPVIFPPPLAGAGCTQVVTGIFSDDMGELAQGAPPGLGPQSSVTSRFIDIAGSDTSPCGGTLLPLPENGIMTDAAIPQGCCVPTENPPRRMVEISLDEGVRLEGGPKLRQKTSKNRIPLLPDPQGARQSKIRKNVSKKSPKMRALSKVRYLYGLMSSLATKLGQPARKTLFQDEIGNLQGIMHVFGAKQCVRSALTPENKTSTAATRQIHACIRCRILKQKASNYTD